jgi:ATP/maltotriose-dependent transcriptional regulator MalT
LADLPDAAGGLMAVSRALRSEVAYEMNDLRRSSEFLAGALGSIEENDAWLDVRAAAYRMRIRLAFARAGLPGALTEVAHCERLAISRDMPRLRRLMRIERIRALTLSDEIDAALSEMRAVGLSPDRANWDQTGDWALRQGTTAVAMARWLVRARRAGEALNFLEPAEDFAIRGGQLLSLAKLRVIRAAAHWKLNRKKDATSALLSALRLLGRQPFRRFILDEGREMRGIVQAALDGDHVTVQPGRQLRRSLSELTHYWETKLDTDVAADGAELQDNHDGHRTRYLELLALGHSNKEIGRIMGVSVNTVKYHLKPIFKDLRADNRLRAVRRARELGILEA